MILYILVSLLFPVSCARVALKAGESRKVTAQVGETVEVELQGLPSAGFFWEVASTPQFLQFKRTEILPSSGGRLGAKQTTVFQFRAADVGEGPVVFRYAQVGRVQLTEMTISQLYIHVLN